MRSKKAVEKAIRTKLNHALDRPLRDQLLARALREQEQSQKKEPALHGPVIRRTIMRTPITRVAAIVLICIGIGVVTAVAVNAVHYYYLGKDDTGHHRLDSTDGQSMVTMDDVAGMDPEQAQRDIEEMKALSEQGRRELVKAVRIDVNGQIERRMLVYRYRLADGRTKEIGDVLPDDTARGTLTGPQHQELTRLREAGPGQDLGTYAEDILGRTFALTRQRYVLGDGTEVIWSAGLPEDTP